MSEPRAIRYNNNFKRPLRLVALASTHDRSPAALDKHCSRSMRQELQGLTLRPDCPSASRSLKCGIKESAHCDAPTLPLSIGFREAVRLRIDTNPLPAAHVADNSAVSLVSGGIR